jgi:hypothetical protein
MFFILSFFLILNQYFFLGFHPTSRNYYLIIILCNAQTHKTLTRCTLFYFGIICFD